MAAVKKPKGTVLPKKRAAVPPKKRAAVQLKKRATVPVRKTPAVAAAPTIELPLALVRELGKDPAATIKALLALREIVGAITPEQLAQNPFLAVTIDAVTNRQPFSTSTIAGLKPWRGTDRELLDLAVKVSGRRYDQIARTGVLREAAIEVQNDFRRQQIPSGQQGTAVKGVRDNDLLAAVAKLRSEGKPITTSTLRTTTGIGFATCERFLARRGEALGLTGKNDSPPAAGIAPAADATVTKTPSKH